ncbi:alpha-E domain-containing protein [Radicibacter daui]|uniref:alpha-E domain-containing protein n=1 Tax=Radicibacter daui TaxID=3064829 RepID=UPI004046BE86
MSNLLLARYAEYIFWLARYMERAENLARILDVNETFSRDSRGMRNWHSIVHLCNDGERFQARYGEVTGDKVIFFYALDRDNSGSIFNCVKYARENARTLRPLISTEMWSQINVVYNWLKDLRPEDVSQHRLSRFCDKVKQACQTHAGITEGTFYRDQGWYFYQMGKQIERADQMTRLIDIKYHLLLPSVDDVGSALDTSQWSALLRSAAGYHAFRRVHPRGMNPKAVAGFMLFSSRFPRSVSVCLHEIQSLLAGLRTSFNLRGGIHASETTDEINAAVEAHTIDRVVAGGLHEYLDWVQCRLIDLTNALGADFFGAETA